MRNILTALAAYLRAWTSGRLRPYTAAHRAKKG